jgi:formiminotetrahydrofolate cyclodeaminase
VDVARAGNPSASSDIGVSVELLRAALHSAALNVGVNLSSLSDSNYVEAVTSETATLENSAAALAAAARSALS